MLRAELPQLRLSFSLDIAQVTASYKIDVILKKEVLGY